MVNVELSLKLWKHDPHADADLDCRHRWQEESKESPYPLQLVEYDNHHPGTQKTHKNNKYYLLTTSWALDSAWRLETRCTFRSFSLSGALRGLQWLRSTHRSRSMPNLSQSLYPKDLIKDPLSSYFFLWASLYWTKPHTCGRLIWREGRLKLFRGGLPYFWVILKRIKFIIL